MTDILLLGKNGQIGYEISQLLKGRYQVKSLSSAQLDLSDYDAVRDTLRTLRPRLVINAAAYTAVDLAENESNRAMSLNGEAPGIIAEELKKMGGALIHFSTDFVFDGSKSEPYTEIDRPNPLNEYGKSKLAGEKAIQARGTPHLILRTSWVYGLRGNNFLVTMVRLLREKDDVRVVDDQTGCPTWCRTVANSTVSLLPKDSKDLVGYIASHSGVYHLSCSGSMTWYDFAVRISDYLRRHGESIAKITGIPSEEYPASAVRPMYSVLCNEKFRETFSIETEDWEAAFQSAVSSGTL